MMQQVRCVKAVPREDRVIVLTGLVGISALAWAYTGYLAWDVGHMEIDGKNNFVFA
jgi:predicted metal-binding membrane protein